MRLTFGAFVLLCLRAGRTRLAMEVRAAMDADPFYGPLHDKERHTVGIEYEVVLELELKALGTQYMLI